MNIYSAIETMKPQSSMINNNEKGISPSYYIHMIDATKKK